MRRLVAFALLLAACTARPSRVVTAADYDALAGKKLFRAHCAMCHGSDAAGTRYAPSLQAPEVQAADREILFRLITDGDLRHGMPAWSRLPDQRRWQIIAYLKSLQP